MYLSVSNRHALAPEQLLDRLRAGDQRPLDALYQVHRDPFVKWAAERHPELDIEAICDAFQEALITFYENVISGRLQVLTAQPQTYLYRLGERFCHKQKKKRGPIVNVFDHSAIKEEDSSEGVAFSAVMSQLLDDPFALSDELAEADHQRHILKRALQLLTAECHRLLHAYYYADKHISLAELSAELGHTTIGVTTARKSYCLAKLRALCRSQA
jgi:DNA-directed RNA polymerase specialized sigma24 family protein